jgi:hypothetical protein
MSLVPVVASAEELSAAVKYAEQHPSARWYVSRRAVALGTPEAVPATWGEAIVAAAVPVDGSTASDVELAARWYAMEETVTASTATADLDTAARERLAKEGKAMKGGGYPIPNRTFLAKAIKAFGRAKNKAATKRHIIKRARALHSVDLIPDSWKPLTSAATVTADETGLWVAQVRDLITEAGHDPDEFEAGTDGFAEDYAEYKDQPQVYVEELIAAFADDDEDGDDDEAEQQPETDEDKTSGDAGVEQAPSPVPGQSQVPSLSPANTALAPVAASAQYATSANPVPGLVQVFTAPQPAATAQDRDALLAAVRQVLREERGQAAEPAGVGDPTADPAVPVVAPEAAAVMPPDEEDPDAAAAADLAPGGDAVPAPDLGAAKDALREKFGKGKPKAKAAPPAPMAASAMRDRIAARTPQPTATLTAAAMRNRLAERRTAVGA